MDLSINQITLSRIKPPICPSISNAPPAATVAWVMALHMAKCTKHCCYFPSPFHSLFFSIFFLEPFLEPFLGDPLLFSLVKCTKLPL